MGSPFENLGSTSILPTVTRPPVEACAAKANAKLGSSTKNRLWGLAGGLEL